MFELTFNHSPAYLLLCAVVAAGMAWLLYQHTPQGTRSWLRYLLMSLRFSMLFLLLSLLVEPLWTAIRPQRYPPLVVVLQDDSESLRAQLDTLFLHNTYPKALDALAQKLAGADAQVHLYSFANNLSDLKSADSLQFRGSGSNPAAALEEIGRRYAEQNLAAVVLATDCISTSGSSPLYAAEGLRVPVYTVLLGDTTPKQDVRIEAVLNNELGYLNNETPVVVHVQQFGYAGKNVQVTLQHNGKTLSQQALRLSDSPSKPLEFNIRLDEPGLQPYDIIVSPLAGERTLRNNRRRVFIQVLDSRLKIVLFAGGPHPDLGAIEAALGGKNKQYEFQSFVRKGAAGYYRAPSEKDITQADLILLHNFPGGPTDRPQLEAIFKAANTGGIPLFHIVGNSTRLNVLPEQAQQMPLFPERLENGTSEVQLSLSQAYLSHATYTFDEDFLQWIASGPPMLHPNGDWLPTNGATIYGTASIKGIALDYPLFALAQSGERKSGILLAENLWRYRTHAYLKTGSFAYFDTWLQNLAQWLTVKEDRRRFRVYPTQPLFTGEDPILFKGQVYDESYNPQSGAEIKLSVIDSAARRQDYYLTEAAPGTYGLEISTLPEGTYRYEATGTKGVNELGKDRGQFTVGRSTIEFIRLQADAPMLRQIALRTDGAFFQPSQLAALADSIQAQPTFKPLVEYRKRTLSLNRYLWPLLLALGLLTTEWVLRKRFGMV